MGTLSGGGVEIKLQREGGYKTTTKSNYGTSKWLVETRGVRELKFIQRLIGGAPISHLYWTHKASSKAFFFPCFHIII